MLRGKKNKIKQRLRTFFIYLMCCNYAKQIRNKIQQIGLRSAFPPEYLRVCLNFSRANTCASFDPNLLQFAISKVCQKTSCRKKNKTDSQMSQSKELWWKQLKRHNDPSCARGFCTMKEQRIEKSLCSIFNRPETNYLCTGHKFGEVLQEKTSPNL